MAEIQLIVQADDFGMCHAVNEGIVRSFVDGIVTQAAMMAPCPWFEEAVALTHDHAIPLGLHGTLTCEWDHLRWQPLTGGASLVGDDGTMHRTIADAIAKLDADEGLIELEAQAARVEAAGLRVHCCDSHMWPVSPPAYEGLCARLGVRFLYPILKANIPFESIRMLSDVEADDAIPDKKTWLLEHIAGLEPGLHYLCTHPAVAGPEIASIARPDADNVVWAERYRVSDLAVLTDPEVRAAIEARGIALVSAEDLAAG